MSSSKSNKMILPIIVVLVVTALALTYFYSDKSAPKVDNSVVQPEVTNKEKIKVLDKAPEVIEKLQPLKNVVAIEEVQPEVILVEGSHYLTKFPNEQSDGPIIIEFFSYMCPHCYNFEPTVTRWLKQKPASVSLLRVPVTFGQDAWRLAAKSYYIAEELKMADTFSQAMFKKIHIENKPPRTENDLGDIFASLGVKTAAFKKAASSFTVDSKLRKADFLAKKYKVSGVPYFLINYKYEMGKASYESEEALFRLWNTLPGKDFK